MKPSVVQLPRIDIPKFSGEITKWENFRDVFESLISNSVSSHSVSDLKSLKDKTHDIYTALLNLKRLVDKWEDLIIFVTVSKLDKSTRRDWELSSSDDREVPNFAKLDDFLTSRIRALEAIHGSGQSANKPESKKSGKPGSVKAHQVSSTSRKCLVYEGSSPLELL